MSLSPLYSDHGLWIITGGATLIRQPKTGQDDTSLSCPILSVGLDPWPWFSVFGPRLGSVLVTQFIQSWSWTLWLILSVWYLLRHNQDRIHSIGSRLANQGVACSHVTCTVTWLVFSNMADIWTEECKDKLVRMWHEWTCLYIPCSSLPFLVFSPVFFFLGN